MLHRSALLLTLVAGAATSAAAQATAVAPRTQVVSVQPISAVLAVFAAEYERAISPAVTFGVGTAVWLPDEFQYTSAELKARYYPQERALTGFSVGASVGFTRIKQSYDDIDDPELDDLTVSGPSAGALLEYGWLLGRERRFYLGLGLGAKAVFVDSESFIGDFTARYPTSRISVGYAF
jgi:hypothetical protein